MRATYYKFTAKIILFIFCMTTILIRPVILQANETAQPAASTKTIAATTNTTSEKTAEPIKATKIKTKNESKKPQDKKVQKKKAKPKAKKEPAATSKVQDFVDKAFKLKPKKDSDPFDLDYDMAKSGTKTGQSTPWYKHWIFWTVIGAAACTGIILGVKYGQGESSTNMNFNIERRN